jgi:hypothetical protein
MKQSEKIVLETLRKTTLAYLSENEYSTLEKAVEANGILNLTGATAHILKSAVVKHGDSHNQGSHGNWANGGMGGGGNSKTTNKPKKKDSSAFVDEVRSEKKTVALTSRVKETRAKLAVKRAEIESKPTKDFFDERNLKDINKVDTQFSRVESNLESALSATGLDHYKKIEAADSAMKRVESLAAGGEVFRGIGGTNASRGIRTDLNGYYMSIFDHMDFSQRQQDLGE